MYHFTNVVLALTIPIWVPIGLVFFIVRAAWYFSVNMSDSQP
jgi:hypothetical protein